MVNHSISNISAFINFVKLIEKLVWGAYCSPMGEPSTCMGVGGIAPIREEGFCLDLYKDRG